MKSRIAFFLLILLLKAVIGQSQILKNNKTDSVKNIKIQAINKANTDTSKKAIDAQAIHSVRLDTITGQSLEKRSLVKWHEGNSMPWIVSLIIALLTVGVNLWISYYTRRTAMKGVQSQIESSTNIAGLQFQSTLNSKNRQEWINDARHCISELLTQCRLLNIQLQDSIQDKTKINALHEKISYNRNKLLLLLNPKINEHDIFLSSMKELINILDEHLLNVKGNVGSFKNFEFSQKSEKLLELGRNLLYFEWQKIQETKFPSVKEK